jgi:hypothetical protein
MQAKSLVRGGEVKPTTRKALRYWFYGIVGIFALLGAGAVALLIVLSQIEFNL